MSSPDSAVDQEQGFLSHLIELRDRLLKMLLAVGVLFLCLFWFSDKIYTALAAPLLRHLPDSQMIAIDVAAPFFIPFKLTLMLCVFLAVPYLLYQIWAFVAPGLYSHEKKLVVPLLVSSTVLFYLGVAFAYFVVFPLVFGFFTSVAPEGVTVSTDIGRYLDFVITLFFAFGIAFEVPVATVLVVAVGITTPDQLVKIRPYVFVAAFIVGMFLTPPDMISQTLLAVPMWLLYEVGIVFSRKYQKRMKAAGIARDKRYDEDDDEADGEPDPDDDPTPGGSGSGGTGPRGSGPGGSGPGGAAVKGGPRSEPHDPEHQPPRPAMPAQVVNKPSNESTIDESTSEKPANERSQETSSEGRQSATEQSQSEHPDNDHQENETPGYVKPSLIEKPDGNGVYRNSLTDFDEPASETPESGGSESSSIAGDKPEKS